MKESQLLKKKKKYLALIDALDVAPNPGKIRFYTSPIPSTADIPVMSQSLVCECVLQKPSGFYDEGNKQLILHAPETGTILSSSTITWARLFDGCDQVLADFTVGYASHDPLWSICHLGDISLDSPIVTAGRKLKFNYIRIQ